MNKTIVAIANEKVFQKLKEIDQEIVKKDIQYKEGILELLEVEKNISSVILKDNLPGNISIQNLIEKIWEKNNKIKIKIWTTNSEKYKNFNKKNLGFFNSPTEIINSIKKERINNRKIENKIETKKINKKNNFKNKKINNLDNINYLTNRKKYKKIIFIKEFSKTEIKKELKNKYKKNQTIHFILLPSEKNKNNKKQIKSSKENDTIIFSKYSRKIYEEYRKKEKIIFFIFIQITMENIKEQIEKLNYFIKKEKINEKFIYIFLVGKNNIDSSILKQIKPNYIWIKNKKRLNDIIEEKKVIYYYFSLLETIKKRKKEIINGVRIRTRKLSGNK